MSRLYGRSLYRVVDAFRRTDVLDTFDRLSRLQWQDYSALRQYQLAELDRLLQHCYENVPFYREEFDRRGLVPGTDDPSTILSSLPVIDREIVRTNSKKIWASNAERFQPRTSSTGGTTSGALHYALSRSAHSTSIAYNLLQWHDAGYHFGDTMIYLGGPSILPSVRSVTSYFYYRLQNVIVLSSFGMDAASMDRYVEVIRRSKAKFLRGYAGSTALLARHILDRGIDDLRLDAVFTTAETLFPHFRESIEKAFHCKVFNEYGARDGSVMAFECSRHSGLHLGSTGCYVEILDDDNAPVPPGQTGYVVVTSLDNFAFPFVRYRIGDRAAMAESLCPCGRGLPLLGAIEGRSGDFITTANGAKIHSEFFSHVFWGFPDVVQFQVRQEQASALELLVVAEGEGLKPKDEERIRRLIEARCGRDMRIDLRTVESIPVRASQKWRYVVSSL